MIIRNALPFALVLLAACARSEEANLMPADANGSTRIAETVRPERDDQEPALGAWRETLQDEARAIEFGPAGAPPLFSIRCDARRGVLLQRHGIEAAGDLPVMLVSVGSETRRLAVTSGEGPLPMLRATLNASDVLVAGLSRAAAPIAVRIGDSPPLILPPSPLIGAYITQCTSGALPAPGGAASVNQAAPANDAAPAD
jgi:hypothetical protein